MVLQSMTDFVLEQSKPFESHGYTQYLSKRNAILTKVEMYAKFLKQPLTLGMFIPCDEEGNVLEQPKDYQRWLRAIRINEFNYLADGWFGCKEYHEAKERVLFSNAISIDRSPYKATKRFMINLNHPAGFRLYNKFTFHDGRIETEFLPNFSKNPTVEYLVGFDLELTPSAIKSIDL